MERYRVNRRDFFLIVLAAISPLARSAAAYEAELADEVASVLAKSAPHSTPPHLLFADQTEAAQWLAAMSRHLRLFIADTAQHRALLTVIHYESRRAGLNEQLILALIEVESGFNRYAVSKAGARGLMQIMPAWQKQIGKSAHNLFDVRTNLRYGCTILRHYLRREKGNLPRALARYNGSLGRNDYPDAVFAAWRRHWQWRGK